MHRILEDVIERPVPRRRVALSGLVLGVVISLVSAGVAFADNLVVDGDGLVPVNTNDLNLGSICVGQQSSGTALLAIQRTGSGSQNVYPDNDVITVTADPPIGNPTVSSSLLDNGIVLPGNWVSQANNTMSSDTATAQVTVTATSLLGPKSATILHRATGASGLSKARNLKVVWTVVACDSTPPVIVPTVSGTLGDNGWYTSDVTLSWSVSDPESAISSSSGCAPSAVDTDTAGQTLTCSATSAGGTSSQSVTIKRDATAPTISGSAAPGPNANGWNDGDVAVGFTCDDAMSGIASCGPDVTLSTEGAGQSASGTAVDNAGNSAGATVSGVNIDKTAPSVSLVGGPGDGASYYYGYVPAAPACDANDTLSGLDGGCTMEGYGTAPGSHTIVATAKDKAGNSNTVQASYDVLPWAAYGFYRPVDMGYLNTVKGGSTVPIKFEAFAGQTELTDPSVVKSLTAVQTACNGTMPSAPVEELATGQTVLRYDWTDGHFVFNWKTPKLPGKCYTFTVLFQDGTSIAANFRLN